MKNKKILALAIASTLGLTACGDDTTALRIDDTIKDSLNRQSSIAFDLISANKTVSLPTYLLMNTSDGTLDIPTTGDLTDRSNPAVAMDDTDGWSPTQPFVIELGLPTGVTLTTDPALLHAAVKIAKVTVNNYVMTSPVALEAGKDYTVISDGTSLTVLPLNGSLDHNSDYIYAITDTLVDSSGEKLGMSTNYAALKNKQIDQSGSSLETPQKIVWQVEGLMDGYGFANYENIIYSSWFTTSSAGEALYFTKIATAQALSAITQGATANAVWQGSANPNSVDLTNLYSPMATALTPTTLASIMLKSTGVDISGSPTEAYLNSQITAHTGKIKLPSFLERDVADDKWKKTPWQSGMPSLAIISGVLNGTDDAKKADLAGQLVAAGIDPTNLADPAEQLKLVGKSFTVGGDPLDSDRLITKYSPLPQVKLVEDVNFLLITPKFDINGDPVTAANKVPVVIYQHGITSIKENILASGNALTKGYAILAIDLPLHGERALSDGTVTDGANADVFMNFEYLPVGRDNMRQAVADLIGLRAGITMIGAAQLAAASQDTPTVLGNEFDLLDTQKVSLFGHSLGAMTSINLQATIDRPMPSGNEYFKIDKAAFANPGGSIPYLLLNSVGFGGTVKHGLMMSSSTDYQAFSGAYCSSLSNTACFNNFYDGAAATPGAQATIDATFQSFALAAQTVLETADPFALARNIDASTPVYLAQVKNDMVIPNIVTTGTGANTDNEYAAPYSPVAGTTPLIAQLSLINIGTDNTGSKKVALLNAGEHSSAMVVDPSNPLASAEITAELQSHITSFLASDDGKTATIIDSNTLE